MRGVQDFEASSYGLRPLCLETWGHLVFLNFGKAGKPVMPVRFPCTLDRVDHGQLLMGGHPCRW